MPIIKMIEWIQNFLAKKKNTKFKQNKTLSLNNHFDKRPNFNFETIIPNKNMKRHHIEFEKQKSDKEKKQQIKTGKSLEIKILPVEAVMYFMTLSEKLILDFVWTPTMVSNDQ